MGKSTGKTGIGVVLKLGSSAQPPVFAAVANVTTLSAGGTTVNMVDATHLASPNFYSEFVPGLKTATEWTLTVQWDPSDPTLGGTTGMKKILEDRALRTFRVDTTAIDLEVSLEADCYVSEMGNVEISPEALMTQSVTLRPSGAPREVTNA